MIYALVESYKVGVPYGGWGWEQQIRCLWLVAMCSPCVIMAWMV